MIEFDPAPPYRLDRPLGLITPEGRELLPEDLA